MKKISVFVLTISAIITYISCKPEPTIEAGTPTTESVDAAAQSAYLNSCIDPSGMNADMCFTMAPAYGNQASATFASGGGYRKSDKGMGKLSEKEVILPEEFQVPNNPYEAQGIAHNRLLFYMISAKRVKDDKDILFNNEQTLNDLTNILSSTFKKDSKQINSIHDALKTVLNLEVYNEIVSKYQNVTYNNMFIDSKMSSTSIEFCRGLPYEVYLAKKKTNGDKTDAVMKLVNKKILILLDDDHKNDKDKTSKLVFLTVYKHSYYYWNN